MASSRTGLYDDPSIYDILHTPGTAEEVTGLEAIEDRFIGGGGERAWLEPACGSGRYLRAAASRGTRVRGFDLSAGMVEYARSRADDASDEAYFVADMCQFAHQLDGFRPTLAFNLINTIRHLPNDEAMLDHLEQISMALSPRGIYAVGLSLTAYGCEPPSEDVWVGVRGRCRVTQVVQFVPPQSDGNVRSRSELVLSHLTIERPSAVEHRDSSYRLRTYSSAQWDALLERSAMRRVACTDERGHVVSHQDGGYAIHVLGVRS